MWIFQFNLAESWACIVILYVLYSLSEIEWYDDPFIKVFEHFHWFGDTYDQPCSDSLKKLKGYLSAVVLCPPVQGWELREGQHSFFWGVTNHRQTGDDSLCQRFHLYQIPITVCRSINENNSGYSLIFRKHIYETLMFSKELHWTIISLSLHYKIICVVPSQ